MTVTIAIDVMGGDHGPRVTVPAALEFLERHADAEVVLVGQEAPISAELKRSKRDPGTWGARVRVHAAAEVVTMDDAPAQALRRKRDSSMHAAVTWVKEGKADAAISAGNTGAWMAISTFILRTLPGIDRPAICAPLPNQKGGSTYVLDLGANVDCKAQHLYQFALMGSALVASVERRAKPTVGLLNIGEEEIKGNETVKETAELLRAAHERGEIEFFGNVEGNDIFKGTTEVVVCDGFVGNVALKSSEGLAQLFSNSLKEEFTSSWVRKLSAFFAMPAVNGFRRRYDPRRFNGACLLGLNGLVVKSHGSADIFSYGCALNRAYEAVHNGLQEDIASRFAAQAAAANSVPAVAAA
ncbi:MAG: plsX [Betaproteobacteria bacterium]|nr:plsX [Betaproteobacteria bacterium]